MAPEYLSDAQDDATRLAIADFEAAGIDIVTDGEMRRESYSNYFATALEGIDPDRYGIALNRAGRQDRVPLVVGPIRRPGPVEVRDVAVPPAPRPDRATKATVPGPFTMSQQSQNDHYPDRAGAGARLRRRAQRGDARPRRAGADVIQVDEPYCSPSSTTPGLCGRGHQPGPRGHRAAPTVLHTCFGYGHFVKEKRAASTTATRSSASWRHQCRPAGHRGGPARPRPHRARTARRQDRRAGVIDLGDQPTSRRRGGGRADPGPLAPPAAGAPRRRAGLRDEVPRPRRCAFAKLQALVEAKLVRAEL